MNDGVASVRQRDVEVADQLAFVGLRFPGALAEEVQEAIAADVGLLAQAGVWLGG